MPVYDFECPKCGTKRTETISIAESEFTPVCACGEVMLKVFAVGGITFNGSGFYSKDK